MPSGGSLRKARRTARPKHTKKASKTAPKLSQKSSRISPKSALFSHFVCESFDACLPLFCTLLTLCWRFFGANRRTFVELFRHAFSQFVRFFSICGHRASKEPREQANFRSRSRTHLPGHVDVFFSSFLCSLLHRFLSVFLSHFCRFFAICLSFFVLVLPVFFRYLFPLLGCFWGAFCCLCFCLFDAILACFLANLSHFCPRPRFCRFFDVFFAFAPKEEPI